MRPEALLWLPGWSFGTDVFDPVIAELSGLAHLRGDFAAAATAEDHLRLAVESLDRYAGPIGPLGPIGVVGWSLGSMVALELAAERPERVGALYLLSATNRFVADDPGDPGPAPAAVRAMASALVADRVDALASFRRRLFAPSEQKGGGAAAFLGAHPDAGLSTESLYAGLEYLLAYRFDGSRVVQPTHLLHGALDAVVPVASAERLAKNLAEARLTVLPGVGHVPFVDAGGVVNWLEEAWR